MKTVFLIGKPGAGKTYIASKIKEEVPNILIFNTDEYINNSFKLITLLKEAKDCKKNILVEGNLINLILSQSIFPDYLLEIEVSDSEIKQVYETERNISKSVPALLFFKYEKEKIMQILSSQSIKYQLRNRSEVLPGLISYFKSND